MPSSDDNPPQKPLFWLGLECFELMETVKREYIQDFGMVVKIVLKVGDGELYPDEELEIANLSLPAHDARCKGIGSRSRKLYEEWRNDRLSHDRFPLKDLISMYSHVPPLELLLADIRDLAEAHIKEQEFNFFDALCQDVLLLGYGNPYSSEEWEQVNIWVNNPTQVEQTTEGPTRYGLKDRLNKQIWKCQREKKKCRDEQAQNKPAEELVQDGNASSDPISKTTGEVPIEMGGGGEGSTKEDDGDDSSSAGRPEHSD